MLPKVVIAILIIAVVAFAFKDKLSTTPSQSNKTEQPSKAQDVKAIGFDEILALGGSCFNLPFIDETKDVEARPDGQNQTKAPDKDEYDINRIAIGQDGDSLISMWEFVGEIGSTWLDEHNITIQTYHDTKEANDDRFEINKQASTQNWSGILISGKDGKSTDFDPQVRLGSKTIQFSIPFNLISQDGIVDGLAFVANFYLKPKKTVYSDTVWPPQNKRVSGHFTTHYCPK